MAVLWLARACSVALRLHLRLISRQIAFHLRSSLKPLIALLRTFSHTASTYTNFGTQRTQLVASQVALVYIPTWGPTYAVHIQRKARVGVSPPFCSLRAPTLWSALTRALTARDLSLAGTFLFGLNYLGFGWPCQGGNIVNIWCCTAILCCMSSYARTCSRAPTSCVGF